MNLIAPAHAQEAAAAAVAGGEASTLMSMLPIFLVVIVFYFLVIRPQSKRIQEHRTMISALKKGDRVVTGGGLVATVVKLHGDDEVVLKLADGVEVTALRTTIMMLRNH